MTGVLFLDIDGVLNSDCYQYGLAMGTPANDRFDPAAVATLNEITRRWTLKLVVSSSWRIMPDIERLLRAHGVHAEIIGGTPFRAGPRGNEISEWLADHPEIVRFVILDDDADMGDLRDHLVQTDYRRGLLPEHIESVAAVLDRRPAHGREGSEP